MKRKFAAIAAALLFLSACSAEKTETLNTAADNPSASQVEESQQPVNRAEENTADAPVSSDASDEMQTKPVSPEVHFSKSFFDVPYEVQKDFEEIVSLRLTLPHVTLDSEAASEKVNAAFVTLNENLENYASSTVYETAQQKNAIGFVDGSYTAEMADGVLNITYTVEEHYSSDSESTFYENSYRFDTATGEQMEN